MLELAQQIKDRQAEIEAIFWQENDSFVIAFFEALDKYIANEVLVDEDTLRALTRYLRDLDGILDAYTISYKESSKPEIRTNIISLTHKIHDTLLGKK